jgi:hypothetical protein
MCAATPDQGAAAAKNVDLAVTDCFPLEQSSVITIWDLPL